MKNSERITSAGLMILGLCLCAFCLAIIAYGQPARADEKDLGIPGSGLFALTGDIMQLGVEATATLNVVAEVEVACVGTTEKQCREKFPNACADYTKRFGALESRLTRIRNKTAEPAFSDVERAMITGILDPVSEIVRDIKVSLVNMRCMEA